MRMISGIALVCVAVLALGGCSSSPKKEEKTVIKENEPGYLQDIVLTVGKVNIVNEVPYTSQTTARDFHVDVTDRLSDFLRDSLRPEGARGALEVAIRNVNVTHETEASDNSIAPLVNVAGFDVYTIDIEIELRRGAENVQLYEGRRISAQRRVKMSEHLSYAKRQEEQENAVKGMMADLKDSLVKNLSELQLIMPRLTIR